jgi:peptidyl-prolyl cis-trans isomerase C
MSLGAAWFMSSSTNFHFKGALAALGFLALAGIGGAQAKVLAKVDGVAITDQDVAVAATDLGSTIPDQLQGAQRQDYVLTYLIDLNLVAKKAAAEKIDQDPDFAREMAYYRQKVLMEGLLGKVAQGASTDAAIQKTYQDAAKAQKPETEIHARHILVPTKAEAVAALKRIKGGEDFGKVADQISKDPGGNGGDLGWFTKDRMEPAFADAAFKLQPGQISDPVQTQFGWHIIQVEGRRTKQFPPLAQVRPDVEHYVQQKAQGDLIMQLRQNAKIERFDVAQDAPGASPAAPGAPAPSAPAAGSQTPAASGAQTPAAAPGAASGPKSDGSK